MLIKKSLLKKMVVITGVLCLSSNALSAEENINDLGTIEVMGCKVENTTNVKKENKQEVVETITSITKSKEFSKKILATGYVGSFSLKMSASKQEVIEETISEISKFVGSDGFCSGGEYNIYKPNFKNDNLFESNIAFSCEFKEKEKYENILDIVKSQKRNFESKFKNNQLEIELNQNQINKKVTKEDEDVSLLELEKEAIEYAYNYGKLLGSKNKVGEVLNCIPKIINLNQGYYHNMDNIRTMAVASYREKTNVSVPLDNDVLVKLNVNYSFDCSF
jgi:hypothetical protein